MISQAAAGAGLLEDPEVEETISKMNGRIEEQLQKFSG
jgi:hypothetical protein